MERRVRTFWLMRRRYRRAALFVTVFGAVTGLVAVLVSWPSAPGAWLQPGFLAAASALVVLGALLPRVMVTSWWRMVRRRNHEEWG